jgi:uncharacterized protein YcfL
MIKLTQRTLTVAILVLAAGCASTAPTSQPVRSPQAAASQTAAGQTSPSADNRVIIDSALDRVIRVLKVIPSTRSNGLLDIQVIVKNSAASPQWLSYRVEWFDQNGQLLAGPTGGSVPWLLLAGETGSFFATAPAVTAKDFEVAFVAAAR